MMTLFFKYLQSIINQLNFNTMKKYNTQTGCYKIDIFYNGQYQCSTDTSKTCKEAKRKYIEKYRPCNEKAITALFYKN